MRALFVVAFVDVSVVEGVACANCDAVGVAVALGDGVVVAHALGGRMTGIGVWPVLGVGLTTELVGVGTAVCVTPVIGMGVDTMGGGLVGVTVPPLTVLVGEVSAWATCCIQLP